MHRAKSARQLRSHLADRGATLQPYRTLDVHRQILVAEFEPGFTAERFQRRHELPAFVAPAPAGLRIVFAHQGIYEGVDVR